MSASPQPPLTASPLLVSLAGFSAGLGFALRLLLPEEPLLSPWPAGWPALAAGLSLSLALLGIGGLRFSGRSLGLLAGILLAALLATCNPGDWPGGTGAGRAALTDALLFAALGVIACQTWRQASARALAGRFLGAVLLLLIAWALFDLLGGRAIHHAKLVEALEEARLRASEGALALSASERARGPFAHSGALATALLLLMPSALAALFARGRKSSPSKPMQDRPHAQRLVPGALAAAFLVAFAATGSFGAWLALSLAAGYSALRWGRSGQQARGRWAAIVTALGLTLLAGIALSSNPTAWLSTKSSAFSVRLGYVSWLDQSAPPSWLWGIGPGRTGEWAEGLASPHQAVSRSLHSGPLQLLLETGIPLGLLAAAPLVALFLIGLGCFRARTGDASRDTVSAHARGGAEGPAENPGAAIRWTRALIAGASIGFLFAPALSTSASPFAAFAWPLPALLGAQAASIALLAFLLRGPTLAHGTPTPSLVRTGLLAACLHLCMDVSLELGSWRALAALVSAWLCAQLFTSNASLPLPAHEEHGPTSPPGTPSLNRYLPWLRTTLGIAAAGLLVVHLSALQQRSSAQLALLAQGQVEAPSLDREQAIVSDLAPWLLAQAAALPQRRRAAEDLGTLLDLGGIAWLRGNRTGSSSPKAATLALHFARKLGLPSDAPLFTERGLGRDALAQHPVGLLILAEESSRAGGDSTAETIELAESALGHPHSRSLTPTEHAALRELIQRR